MSSEYITDVIDIPSLIGYVREQTDGELPFEDIFPVEGVDDIEYELTQVPAFTGNVAKYRSWDTAPPLGNRPGVTIVGGEIPPLGLSFRLNEKDIVRFNKLKAGVADKTDARVSDRIFGDAANAGHAVQNRITLAHGEALTLGKVTLTELGDVVTGNAIVANFGVPGGHFVTAGTLWSDTAASTPITNLKAYEATYYAANLVYPDAWMISSAVMANLALNAQVRNLAQASTANPPGIINADIVQAVFTAAGIKAPFVVSDVMRPALDGSGNARVISDRKVVAIRQGMGKTLYGPSANAANLAGEGTIAFQDAPGVIAFIEKQLRPAAIITTGEAVAIPVVLDPYAVFCATV